MSREAFVGITVQDTACLVRIWGTEGFIVCLIQYNICYTFLVTAVGSVSREDNKTRTESTIGTC